MSRSTFICFALSIILAVGLVVIDVWWDRHDADVTHWNNVHLYEAGQHDGQVGLCLRQPSGEPMIAACMLIVEGWTVLPKPGQPNLMRCDVPADGCGR